MVRGILSKTDGSLSSRHRTDKRTDIKPIELMITKRLFSIIFAMPMAVSSFADSGLSGLSDAADGVGSYLPYVQGVCYAIAAVIAVAGAMSIYLSMQTNPNQIRKRICMCFVLMATALPQFFGVDGSGSSTGGSSSSSTGSGNSDGFLASDQGGISQTGINTEIPSFHDKTGNWITFPPETNMTVANHLMDIYDHFGSGREGSYGRTLAYIHNAYRQGQIDHDMFEQLMRISGNLPHN